MFRRYILVLTMVLAVGVAAQAGSLTYFFSGMCNGCAAGVTTQEVMSGGGWGEAVNPAPFLSVLNGGLNLGNLAQDPFGQAEANTVGGATPLGSPNFIFQSDQSGHWCMAAGGSSCLPAADLLLDGSRPCPTPTPEAATLDLWLGAVLLLGCCTLVRRLAC
ncbi:MAG: hypothetical protein ACRD04_02825 [Terriglobales bacterium]